MKFHDGEPLNAEAVKFNIERHLDHARARSASRRSARSRRWTWSTTSTVRLNLSQPLVPLLAALTDRARA